MGQFPTANLLEVSRAGLDRAWSSLAWWEVSLPWHTLEFKVPSKPNQSGIL